MQVALTFLQAALNYLLTSLRQRPNAALKTSQLLSHCQNLMRDAFDRNEYCRHTGKSSKVINV